MPNAVTYEIAESGDLDAIRAVLTVSDLAPGRLQEMVEFIVARAGVAMAGVVGLERHGDAALLRSLAVAPWARSRGTARNLLLRAIASAQVGGAKQAYLLTTTARGYFEGCGFEACGRDQVPTAILCSPTVAAQCPESATCMSLDLRSAPLFFSADTMPLLHDEPSGARYRAAGLAAAQLSYFEVPECAFR